MTTRKIIATVQKIKELEMQVKVLQDQIDELKQPLKDEMTKLGKEEVIAGVYKLRYVDVSTARFNQAAFKKANAKLYEKYCVPSTSKRFSIN